MAKSANLTHTLKVNAGLKNSGPMFARIQLFFPVNEYEALGLPNLSAPRTGPFTIRNYSGGFLSFGEEGPTVEGSAKVFEDWQR